MSLLLLFNQAGIIAVGTAIHIARAHSRLDPLKHSGVVIPQQRGAELEAQPAPPRGRGLKLKGRC